MTAEVQNLLKQGNNILIEQRGLRKHRDEMIKRHTDLSHELEQDYANLDTYMRACILVANTADENTKVTLDRITGVINRTLALLFTEEKRTVTIKPTTYRNSYPHYNVVLTTESGVVRTFKQSGTGLGQVISFLFTLCLIDARGGRKVLVMDELLNGLHPDAKVIVKDLMLSLNKRFQFVCVEYGLDVGKEYEVKKTGAVSSVSEYKGNYYKDTNMRIGSTGTEIE